MWVIDWTAQMYSVCNAIYVYIYTTVCVSGIPWEESAIMGKGVHITYVLLREKTPRSKTLCFAYIS